MMMEKLRYRKKM